MTFDEVDEQLTLQRYNALQRFWIKHPPTAILIAHYVGYKSPTGEVTREVKPNLNEPELEEMDDESMAALASFFGLPVRIPKGSEDGTG